MMRTTKQLLGRLLVFAVVLCEAGSTVAQELDRAGIKGKMRMELKVQTSEIKRAIEDLDIKYQLAVKNNDAETMDEILSDDFILITGKGMVFTKRDLLAEARGQKTVYERQEDSRRTVRVWGDTAIITALLWEKGASNGKPFDKKLWFSDVYKLTPSGWKYVFAQASIPLPQDE
jgi:ketosteroid isomerase-like protein